LVDAATADGAPLYFDFIHHVFVQRPPSFEAFRELQRSP
jgi:hypothetical protein